MGSLVVTVGGDTPIVMSAAPGATDLGVISWSDPPILRLNTYSPDVPYLDGSTALSWRRQQTLVNAQVAPFGAANEAEAEALVAALDAAISRIGFTVTRNRNGVEKMWRCDAGSLTPNGATTKVTVDRPWVTVYDLSIPCFPVPVS